MIKFVLNDDHYLLEFVGIAWKSIDNLDVEKIIAKEKHRSKYN